eukprot:CAMPEP_0183785944 /NCGR_PEP_ID=MMETSP0739-20130205/66765_1 /TAXON_ID=385413 /ORGANISM="Thalassiosira miniscula, Strain CCMP1093" /LENGTH=342 /DNA_ID=CAMNT_0026029965 /DNA_START=401 /DNA_END=1429 /DNA_ORIENTATION=+
MGRIVYGAKSKGEDTAELVKEAIQSGFRHVATGAFHDEYNEAGVGEGWKESGVPRNELYLQTLFLPNSVNGYGTQNCKLDEKYLCPPSPFHDEYNEAGVGEGWKESGVPRNELYLQTLFLPNSVNGYGTQNCKLDEKYLCPPSPDLSVEDQVHLSIKSSLHNLQTNYIDAVLVYNFHYELQKYEDTLEAWKVLERYVDRGIIRHLGVVSVHYKEYLIKLYEDTRIKPAIIQNRFHLNSGYDMDLRPIIKNLGMENQLFWILSGSSGERVRKNALVKIMASQKGVTPQILLYSFTMQIGGTPLIGTKSVDFMREDVNALIANKIKWEKDDLVAMASVITRRYE